MTKTKKDKRTNHGRKNIAHKSKNMATWITIKSRADNGSLNQWSLGRNGWGANLIISKKTNVQRHSRLPSYCYIWKKLRKISFQVCMSLHQNRIYSDSMFFSPLICICLLFLVYISKILLIPCFNKIDSFMSIKWYTFLCRN